MSLPRLHRLGHVYQPDNSLDWMQDFATTPTALLLSDRIRVFYSTRPRRDSDGCFVSRTSYVDLDRADPRRVMAVHRQPIIELGKPGSFDEFGIMVAEAVSWQGHRLLYYMGWQRQQTTPYHVQLGLAVADGAAKDFRKHAEGPVLGDHALDPYGIGNVCVRAEGDSLRMWYTAFLPWVCEAGRWTPRYALRQAYSRDGVEWLRDTDYCLSPYTNTEAIATPAVHRQDMHWHLWFSTRERCTDGSAGAYRIGYASSDDGTHWRRDDAGGLLPSGKDWDSEMCCYPALLEVDGRLLCFYCGNGYGATGFGLAEVRLP